MYKIYFYKDRNGKEPVAEYIANLTQKKDKDSRIKLNKIRDYIKALSEHGTAAGAPFVKHIDGELWELRPLRDRIFFASWANGSFILLHQFMKKTQKTPAREIEKAKRALADLIKRGISYE
ncbi:MAG: type II toxin-antitoxin system RelE/ParE family toxin [Bacillota bacterium]|nr:type II toxin-antitoxin system RelE/ParE family toxin [Bacillota bacterium]